MMSNITLMITDNPSLKTPVCRSFLFIYFFFTHISVRTAGQEPTPMVVFAFLVLCLLQRIHFWQKSTPNDSQRQCWWSRSDPVRLCFLLVFHWSHRQYGLHGESNCHLQFLPRPIELGLWFNVAYDVHIYLLLHYANSHFHSCMFFVLQRVQPCWPSPPTDCERSVTPSCRCCISCTRLFISHRYSLTFRLHHTGTVSPLIYITQRQSHLLLTLSLHCSSHRYSFFAYCITLLLIK